jgi:hypothetical protein
LGAKMGAPQRGEAGVAGSGEGKKNYLVNIHLPLFGVKRANTILHNNRAIGIGWLFGL